MFSFIQFLEISNSIFMNGDFHSFNVIIVSCIQNMRNSDDGLFSIEMRESHTNIMEQLSNSLNHESCGQISSSHSISAINSSGPSHIFLHVHRQLLVAGQVIIQHLISVFFFRIEFEGIVLWIIITLVMVPEGGPTIALHALTSELHVGVT